MNLTCETSLPLFQSTHKNDIPNSLKKSLILINNMIELHYIEYNNSELRFTNAGIKYMERKYKQFCDNIQGKNIDFGPFQNLIQQLSNSTFENNTGLKFDKKNFLINYDSEPNYNNINFTSKNKDFDELFD